MKRLILLPLMASLFSVPVNAQQVNEFQTCTRHREVYTPGNYDYNGNYVPGRLIIFPGKHPHRGLAPTVPHVPRYTTVYRIIPEEKS